MSCAWERSAAVGSGIRPKIPLPTAALLSQPETPDLSHDPISSARTEGSRFYNSISDDDFEAGDDNDTLVEPAERIPAAL